jgi:hypothetical protein
MVTIVSLGAEGLGGLRERMRVRENERERE